MPLSVIFSRFIPISTDLIDRSPLGSSGNTDETSAKGETELSCHGVAGTDAYTIRSVPNEIVYMLYALFSYEGYTRHARQILEQPCHAYI